MTDAQLERLGFEKMSFDTWMLSGITNNDRITIFYNTSPDKLTLFSNEDRLPEDVMFDLSKDNSISLQIWDNPEYKKVKKLIELLKE